MTKSARQLKILEIIQNKAVKTQNQLIRELELAGFSSTQATISRDIKELRLVKELGTDGIYKYVSTSASAYSNRGERLRTIFRESVTSTDCAQNIVVIKTLPGLAPAACSALDVMRIDGLVGTIAGDDTAFLAMRDNEAARRFCVEIEELL